MATATTAHPLPHTRAALGNTLGEAIGAASMCWENVAAAGVFESTRAAEICRALEADVERITAYTEPRLGLATTAELAEELAVRLADPVSADPNYRTIDSH